MAYTHFLSVPINSCGISEQLTKLKDKVNSMKVTGVTPSCWQSEAKNHLTILMLDLSDPVRLKMCQNVLNSLDREIQTDILDATGGSDPTPINLTFKGLRSFQKDPKQCRVIFCDLVRDKSYDLLVKISNLLIETMLAKGVVDKDELSHITY